MSEHTNGRPPPGSTTDLPESDDSAARLFPARLFFILDTATQLVSTTRKIKDKETRELVRLRRKNAVRWMLRLKVAFGPLWDPRKNRRGSQAVCRCLCHLYSAVAQCYEAMRQEVVTILPFFAFWAEEDLICEDWFEGHVISGDRKRSSLTNRELATITRPIEQFADDIDHHVGNLRDMVWREFKDWPRRVRSPAALDPSPRVQKTPPALPRSPTPEAATNGPIPESPADRIELAAAAPSENGTAAIEAPAAPETSPAWNDLQQAAFTSLLFVRAAERLRTSLEGDDEDAIFVECVWYCRYASNLDALLKRGDWKRDRGLTVRALRLGHTLDARWLSLKRKSGITEFDLVLNLIDAPITEYNPGDPFPFWVGHELTYRRFYENAVELLEVLNQTMKDSGPIPFLDTLDPSDNDPAATDPQANGQAAPPVAPQASQEDPGGISSNPSSPARESTPEGDADVWISFAQAHQMTGLEPYQLTRVCDSEKARSKGRGKGRLVHSGDLARFVTENENSSR